MFKYVSERHVIDFIVNFEHIFAPLSLTLNMLLPVGRGVLTNLLETWDFL